MSTYPFYPYAKYTLGFKRLKNIRSKHLALLLHEGRVDFYFLGTGDVGNRITKKVFLKGKKYMENAIKSTHLYSETPCVPTYLYTLSLL